MTVYAGNIQTFKPESYIPTFTYFPLFLNSSIESISLENLTLEYDETGRQSIIKLVDKDNKKIIPFIDLNKYDQDTKQWFIYSQEDRLPYRFVNSNILNMYPSNIGPQTSFIIKETKLLNNEILISGESNENASLSFYKYYPILIVKENQPFNDLTDYTNIIEPNTKLSPVSSILEFYYNFEDRLYTNQDFGSYDIKNVKIILNKVGNNTTTLKCLLSSNSGSRARHTPIIYDYILKLKGQYLRG